VLVQLYSAIPQFDQPPDVPPRLHPSVVMDGNKVDHDAAVRRCGNHGFLLRAGFEVART
jgi:hypothetical protein